jgi:polar amino acid transport system substrate-binding protein
MRYRFILAVLLFAVYMTAKATPLTTLTLATGEWPPYFSEHLKHQGFVTRIVTEGFAAEGIQVRIRFYPWSRVSLITEKGVVDGAFAYSRSPERESLYLYSTPLIVGNNVFYHLKSKSLK